VYKEGMSASECSLQCRKCGYVFVNESPDTPQEERKSCPECGSAGRAIGATHTDPMRFIDYTKLKARHGVPGKIKPYLESGSGKEIFRKTGRVSQVEQIVDRENNKYYKHVEDAETGQVIKHQEEPLNRHIPDHQKREGSGKQ
jgi:hypothetical protein